MRNSYDKSLDNFLFKFNNKSNAYSFLTEGITELQRYYPKLDVTQLQKLAALDPTYKGGDALGKYGRWIINLYYNSVKNKERLKQYNQFKNRPENKDKVINQPVALPEIKDEDLYKVTDSLKAYDTLKGKIGRPVTDFKTLPELDAEIAKYKNVGTPVDTKVLKRYECFKKAEPKGLKKIYEDNEWMIGIPTTLESSTPFGEFTSWCTTSAHGSYYNQYTQDGPLFILLNKKSGELFQFHFETESFMNEHDRSINMDEFTVNYENICKFLYNYVSDTKHTTDPIKLVKDTYKKYVENPEIAERSYFRDPNLENVQTNDEVIAGDMNLEYTEYLYEKDYYSSRDKVSFDTMISTLNGDDPYVDYGESDLSDYSYLVSDDFDKIFKEEGVNITYKDIINGNYPEELREIFEDDFYNDVGLEIFIGDCSMNGCRAEFENAIIECFQDNFPILQFNDNTNVVMQINLEDFYKMIWRDVLTKKGINPDSIKFIKYDEEYQPNLFQINDVAEPFDEDWYRRYSNRNIDYDEDDLNWLYSWRELKGKDAFVLYEPRYGWSGFDDREFKDGCQDAARRCKEILENKSEE